MNSTTRVNRFKKILLIDDDEVDIFISNKIIRSTSLADEVISKRSAEEGLNFLKSLSETPDELPDIIFLDLGMPMMDGYDFLNEFDTLEYAVKSKCRIVLLTNAIDPGNTMTNRIRKNPAISGILGKPLTAEALEKI